MSDIKYKTTYTKEEIHARKEAYLESKQVLISYLQEVTEILKESGETPITGEVRKSFMDKFSTIDRTLISKFDKASYEYFEATENEQV